MQGWMSQRWTKIPTVALCLLFLCVCVLGAAGGIILFAPLIVALFGGIFFTVLCFRSPLTGFSLAASLFIFETVLLFVPSSNNEEAGFANTLSAADLALVVLVTCILVRALFTKDEAILKAVRSHALFLLLCALLLLLSIPGLLYADSAAAGVVALLRMVSGMLLSILALLLVRSFDDIRRFTCLMLPGLAIAALWGWYEVLAGEYVLVTLGRYVPADVMSGTDAGYYRSIGPVGDSVYFSVLLVFGMALSLIHHQLTHSRLLRMGSLLVLVLCASAVMTTGSRGGLLAALILAGIYFLFATMRHKIALLIAIVVVGTLGMGIYSITVSTMPLGRLASTGGSKDATTEYRLGLYAQSSRMFVDSPVFGVGHGQFTQQSIHYFDRRTPRPSLRPHSVYFELLAEDGLLAFGIYLVILAICVLPLLSVVMRLERTHKRNAVVCLFGLVLAYVFFDTNTNLREDNFVWLSFALAQVVRQTLNKPEDEVDSTGLNAGLA